jgi:LPXTG-site transpeptidase (sortase) family protein
MSLAVSAHAADYSFSTTPSTNYYGSTNYEDKYDAAYKYGGTNQIDFDIPALKYGLSQEFLESSLSNPYLTSGTQYGLGSSGSTTTATDSSGYPDVDFSSVSSGGSFDVSYVPSVTLSELTRSDGSIGTVSIARVGLSAKVYEGATTESMAKGAGHYETSGIFTGNIGLFGHNRGSHAYFANLKNVKLGDTVTYETSAGTKTYKVTFVGSISYTDYSYLNEMGDNRITLITCIANQPSLRLCVQATEIQ